MGGADELGTRSARIFTNFLCCRVAIGDNVAPEVLDRKVSKVERVPAAGCYVRVLADKTTEFIRFGGVWDGLWLLAILRISVLGVEWRRKGLKPEA